MNETLDLIFELFLLGLNVVSCFRISSRISSDRLLQYMRFQLALVVRVMTVKSEFSSIYLLRTSSCVRRLTACKGIVPIDALLFMQCHARQYGKMSISSYVRVIGLIIIV